MAILTTATPPNLIAGSDSPRATGFSELRLSLVLLSPSVLQHLQYRNNVQEFTVAAFQYWITPHLGVGSKPEESTKEIMGNMAIAGQRLRATLRTIVLARTYSSIVFTADEIPEKFEESLPQLNIITDHLVVADNVQGRHDFWIRQCGVPEHWARLLEEFQTQIAENGLDTGNLTQSMQYQGSAKKLEKVLKGRSNVLANAMSTHVGNVAFRGLSLAWFRKKRRFSLAQMLEYMKSKGAMEPAARDRQPRDAVDTLRRFLWGSPKFAHMLRKLRELRQDADLRPTHRKVLMFCNTPKTVELIHKLLGCIGINCIAIDSSMKPQQREDDIQRFNTTPRSTDESVPSVLITTHAINIAGHDCQQYCSRVFVIEPAWSIQAEHQGLMRVYRMGQQYPVKVSRFFTDGTYNEMR